MRTRHWLASWFVILLVFALQAGAVTGEDASAAVRRLSTVGMFAFGGVGFAGRTSEGELDFRQVYAQPPEVALAAFEKVYAEGTLPAKAYALVAIRELSPNRFRELLTPLAKSGDKVQTAHGCVISREPVSAVARQIAAGDYRGPAESVAKRAKTE